MGRGHLIAVWQGNAGEGGRTRRGMIIKLLATSYWRGRPLNLFVTASKVSDYIGAPALLRNLQNVDWPPGDRGYNADRFWETLKDKGASACAFGRKRRKKPSSTTNVVANGATAFLAILLFGALSGCDRHHVRQVDRLAACGKPLRQALEGLLVSNLTRSIHYLLAMDPGHSTTADICSAVLMRELAVFERLMCKILRAHAKKLYLRPGEVRPKNVQ